ncbi:MAG: DUF6526 family protein [Acidobacteriota bacterium]
MEQTQNYSNHTRWYPLVHFVILPLLLLNLIWQIVRLIMAPEWERVVWTIVSVVLIMMVVAARQQALRAQDRIIQLEERIRYKELLSPELAARAAELQRGQIIALRFASDGELPALVEQTLDGKFGSSKEIKMAIKVWRADHLRV